MSLDTFERLVGQTLAGRKHAASPRGPLVLRSKGEGITVSPSAVAVRSPLAEHKKEALRKLEQEAA